MHFAFDHLLLKFCGFGLHPPSPSSFSGGGENALLMAWSFKDELVNEVVFKNRLLSPLSSSQSGWNETSRSRRGETF